MAGHVHDGRAEHRIVAGCCTVGPPPWTDWRSATRFSGMLAGELKSAAAFGTKENPVIAPPALRLTSAVICCHRGRPAEGNDFTSSVRSCASRQIARA